MIRLCHIYILLTALLTLAGCVQGTEYPFPEPRPVSRQPIDWTIDQISTRALANNNLLQETCTPTADNTNESIGVWGDYTTNSGGENVTIKEFIATPLTFIPGSFNSWEYPGEARYWEYGAVYDFRACYPQKLMTSLMTQMDATMIQGALNTSTLQEDILVAATQVNTRTANLSVPVRLNMQHIFATIKFKVKAVDGFMPAAGEGVTSCWLQNKENATNLFSPAGYLVHSGNAQPEITWHPYESSSAPMYVWEHQGVDFYYENTLYTPNGGMKGEEYTHNDGWLLVVPQTVKEGTLQFCYTLKNAGSQVFSTNIPAVTYEHGKQYTYMLEIRGSSVEVKLTITPWNHLESSYDITI
jgi:hypothetical protein